LEGVVGPPFPFPVPFPVPIPVDGEVDPVVVVVVVVAVVVVGLERVIPGRNPPPVLPPVLPPPTLEAFPVVAPPPAVVPPGDLSFPFCWEGRPGGPVPDADPGIIVEFEFEFESEVEVWGDAEAFAFGVDGNADDGDADDVAVVVPLGVGVEGRGGVGSDILNTFRGRSCLYEVRCLPKLPATSESVWSDDRVGEVSLMRCPRVVYVVADENAFPFTFAARPGFYVEASFDWDVWRRYLKAQRENGMWCARKEVDDRVDEVNGWSRSSWSVLGLWHAGTRVAVGISTLRPYILHYYYSESEHATRCTARSCISADP
jgi:hypothetical protein